MTEPILFYFDFSSPYSYFMAQKIDILCGQFDRHVEWKPMMLGPAFKQSGNLPLIHQPLKGDYCSRDWERMGRFMDVPWVMPDPFPVATHYAARIFYAQTDRDPAQAKQFAINVFDTYFGRGIDVSKEDAVLKTAADMGLDVDECRKIIHDQKQKDRLRAETEDAINKGVFGAPFVIIDGEPFWGADRMWMIRRWLKSGGW